MKSIRNSNSLLIGIVVIVVTIALASCVSSVWVRGGSLEQFHVKASIPEYAGDFSDDRVLVGASHNIFVGKVIEQVGNKERGIGPETQFQVEIIENIKGNLQGDVTVNQLGGYKDGSIYMEGGDESGSLSEKDYMLKIGATYLFATRYNPTQNWYTVNSYPTASKLLSTDKYIAAAAVKLLANRDMRVQQLKAAYPEEVLLDADIAHDNTRNSYIAMRNANVQPSIVTPIAPKYEPDPDAVIETGWKDGKIYMHINSKDLLEASEQ